MLCTGCHDGIVRVYDLASPSVTPKMELKGHTARVFNTVWSPLLEDVLCSGSDDKNIIVWNIKTVCRHQLTYGLVMRGHVVSSHTSLAFGARRVF